MGLFTKGIQTMDDLFLHVVAVLNGPAIAPLKKVQFAGASRSNRGLRGGSPQLVRTTMGRTRSCSL